MNDIPFQSSDLTAVCHVRAPLLLEPLDSKIETLRTCEANGDIDSLLLRSWPDEVALTETSPNQEVVDCFERFEQWADAHGVSVRPPFAIRTSTSLVSDDSRPVLVTPLLCLALYYDDSLVGVYPHSDGETTDTATEAIAALRTGEVPTLPEPPAPSTDGVSLDTPARVSETEPSTATTRHSVTTPTSCPHCERQLVNVHGIWACTDCQWNDTYLDDIQSPQAKLIYLSLMGDPVSIEALKTTLDLPKLSLYGILRSLSERGFIEQTDAGTYRARRLEWSADERAEPVLRPE